MAQFKPGQSGNPAGRPPKGAALADLIDAAMSRDDEIAIVQQAVTQAKLGDKDARSFLFDRKYGKPAQAVEVTGGDGEPLHILVTYAADTDSAAAPAPRPAADPPGG